MGDDLRKMKKRYYFTIKLLLETNPLACIT